MKQTVLNAACLWLIGTNISIGADRFDTIKQEIAQSACTRFEFVSIIESEIFEATDSAIGTAYIARDGRFNVTVGTDQYLFDQNLLYSYSVDNNQVVIEKVSDTEGISREISFITRLDEFYKTHTVQSGRSYRLIKRPSRERNIPDSVTVFIASELSRLERLEYYDINEELNVIVILNQQTSTECDERQFEPAFPDSVERIKL